MFAALIIQGHQLAQIGLPSPDSILKAQVLSLLLCVGWWILLIASLSVVVFGAGIRRRSGRVMMGLGGVVASGLLLLAYLVVVPPHFSVTWDFSSSRAAPDGNWVNNGMGREMISYQGRVDAHIKLPDGRNLDDRATLLVLDRNGAKVSRLFFQKSGLSMEDGFSLTAKYLSAWGFDPKNFDQWCADRRQGKRERYGDDRLFYSYQNNADPPLSLELREAASSDSWALNLTVVWPRENRQASTTRAD